MEASSGEVCPITGKSHWLTVSNNHCPPGTICVYDRTKGAITADTKNQVAAVMYYKEAEICA